MKKIISIIAVFVIAAVIFNVAKFFLPPNFHGIQFYSLILVVDLLCLFLLKEVIKSNNLTLQKAESMHNNKYSSLKRTINNFFDSRWFVYVYFIHFILLLLISLLGIFFPLPDWNIYFKLILATLLFSTFAAHFVFIILIVITWLVRKTRIVNLLLIINIIVSSIVLFALLSAPFTWTKSINISRVSIVPENIPTSFNDYKIIHLSDIHADYFVNDKMIRKTAKIINDENPNLILITGDFVSYKASELKPFIDSFKELKASSGIYVVLGNHDYGTYYTPGYQNKDYETDNLNEMIGYFKELNWSLLRNESVYLTQNNDTIVLAGTEHYNRKEAHYPSNADIKASLKNIPESLPVICMTHNPDYWVDVIRYMENSIFLTFSGHTHGMQVGIHGKSKINMYRLKNKFTAGLYEHKDKYLYINTGFGTVGFPFRVGMKPEITVIELKSDKTTKSVS